MKTPDEVIERLKADAIADVALGLGLTVQEWQIATNEILTELQSVPNSMRDHVLHTLQTTIDPAQRRAFITIYALGRALAQLRRT